jgi:hypothetical protein
MTSESYRSAFRLSNCPISQSHQLESWRMFELTRLYVFLRQATPGLQALHDTYLRSRP